MINRVNDSDVESTDSDSEIGNNASSSNHNSSGLDAASRAALRAAERDYMKQFIGQDEGFYNPELPPRRTYPPLRPLVPDDGQFKDIYEREQASMDPFEVHTSHYNPVICAIRRDIINQNLPEDPRIIHSPEIEAWRKEAIRRDGSMPVERQEMFEQHVEVQPTPRTRYLFEIRPFLGLLAQPQHQNPDEPMPAWIKFILEEAERAEAAAEAAAAAASAQMAAEAAAAAAATGTGILYLWVVLLSLLPLLFPRFLRYSFYPCSNFGGFYFGWFGV